MCALAHYSVGKLTTADALMRSRQFHGWLPVPTRDASSKEEEFAAQTVSAEFSPRLGRSPAPLQLAGGKEDHWPIDRY
jgi:hypothetical protein